MNSRHGRLLLPPSFICLALSLAGGLSRMGVVQPPSQQIVLYHGPLLVVGFLAALIAAERAITLNNVFMHVASGFFSCGGLLLVFSSDFLTAVLWLGGGLSFALWALWMIIKFRKNFSNLFFAAASILLLTGNTFFVLDYPTTYYVFAWVGFFITFIVGERMDMLKIAKASRLTYLTASLSIPLLFTGLALAEKLFFAAAFTTLLITAVKHDVALKFLGRKGFGRYLALGLTIAYAWLAVAALVWATSSSTDAMLHSIFLGFVGSMVFAHAPIIFPAIMKISHFYTPILYIPFTLLQLSTLARVASAYTIQLGLWSLSGLLTVTAVACFIAVGPGSVFVKKTFYAK
ncbi:MAG: hypothetical protein QW777_07540 [Candidatus Caldarchaeum sp.]